MAMAPKTRQRAGLVALLPVAVIVALVGLFLAFNPIASLREVPPVEAIAFEQTVLTPNRIELSVRNDGPDEVNIAQVLVNDAYWDHTIDNPTLGRLATATVVIPYPWDDGQPLAITLLTSTGVTITHDIEAAALTPQTDARTIGIYALLGLYIGVIPVAIGLCWLPALRRASDRWLGFFLAFTLGLLAFLLVDTVAEGLEFAAQTAAVLDGLLLFAISALAAAMALVALGDRLGREAGAGSAGGQPRALTGLALAYFIAAGIGLHNLGEGLAVGAALAAGEVALGTFLVLGFAIHNTTEGLAIVAPIRSEADRPARWHFAALGALAGAPTIAGALAGGFTLSPAWSAIAFGIAAGTIAQVIWAVGRSAGRDTALRSSFGLLGFLGGLLFMYATGLLAA
ncbi:MAG: ZIP family metal transporter [Egibacteraceae bacterium]